VVHVGARGETGSKRGLVVPKKPYDVDDVRVHSSAPNPYQNRDCSTEKRDLVSSP
jgi:hypothetical protein